MSASAPIQQDGRPAFDLFQGFAVASVLAGLEMCGDLAPLGEDGISQESIAGRPDEEAQLLTASLRYLKHRGVVDEDDGGFTLTGYGRDVYDDRGFLVWMVGGYGDPMRRLDAFLGMGKRYGVDFTRDGRWVADGTTAMALKNIIPDAMGLLDRIEFGTVLDLGCGNARFLTGICSKFEASGIGVDNSEAAVAQAEKVIADQGMREQVQVITDDVRSLDAVPGIGDVDMVITFFLLHEILATGRERLVDYLTELARRLPTGANLVIGEIEPPHEGSTTERFTPEFTYVHALMRQRLAFTEEWTGILDEGGFEVSEVVRCKIPGGILLHCRNRGDKR